MDSPKDTSIYKMTLWPMRIIMYATTTLPYEFNPYHKDALKGNLSLGLISWRLLHQILVATFVAWISMLRLQRYHEVLYKLNDAFSNSIDMVSYGTLIAIYLIAYWENTWKAHQYRQIFDNFEIIRLKFRILNVDLKTNRLRIYVALVYSLLGFYMFTILLVIYIRYVKSLNAVRLLVSQYCDINLKLKLTEFTLFVTIVMVMQTQLNAFATEYMEHKVARLHGLSDGSEKHNILATFAILQDIHKLLVLNVGYMETYFCWSLPGLLLKMFSEMVYTSYWIYFSADFEKPGYFRLYGVSTMIWQLIMLFVTCYICSRCEILNKQFSNIFHMTKYDRHNSILISLKNEISLQLIHANISFTAGGFVDVNYSFFGKFIFMAICYIVILIQFHMSV